MTIIARAYGLGEPFDWGPDCDAELWRQRRLWNTLVAIHEESRDAYQALLAEDPEVAELTAERDHLKAECASLDIERKKARTAARGKAKTPELDARIREATAALAGVSARLREAKTRSKAARHAQVEALNAKHLQDVKDARNASGLFWCNYNAVCQSYQVARSRIMKTPGAELRLQHAGDDPERYRGDGRITQQLPGGLGVDALFAGRSIQVRVDPIARQKFRIASRSERDRQCRSVLTIGVYARARGDYRTVRFPIMMHRPLPDNGVIKMVTVTRRKLASSYRWQAVFTIDVPAASANAVAVDLGWRRIADQGLRVATVLAAGDAAPTHVMLPERWRTGWDHIDSLYSERVKDANETFTFLRGLPWHTAPATLQALWTKLSDGQRERQTKASFLGSPGLMASLSLAWRAEDWRPVDRDELESWRKRDKRAWLESANLRDKLRGVRTQTYRNAARDIVAGRDTIILEEFDLAEAAVVDGNPLHRAQRRNRVLACVHELRHWIRHAASKSGAKIVTHRGVSTWLCSECGADIGPRRPEELWQSCPSCNARWDQDENACRNMLAALDASASAPDESPEALALEAA